MDWSPGPWVLLLERMHPPDALKAHFPGMGKRTQICCTPTMCWASQVALVVKNLAAKAEDVTDAGSIPGSGRSPGEGMSTHSSILTWRIPWTEEPGGLQSMGLQSQSRLKRLSMHAWMHYTYICLSLDEGERGE